MIWGPASFRCRNQRRLARQFSSGIAKMLSTDALFPPEAVRGSPVFAGCHLWPPWLRSCGQTKLSPNGGRPEIAIAPADSSTLGENG